MLLSAAVMIFAASSCQKDEFRPGMGGDTIVTLEVELPGEFHTKAVADGKNVDILHYAIFAGADPAAVKDATGALYQSTAPVIDREASVSVELVNNQDYTLIFWAEVEGKGHYDTEDLREVKANTTKLEANDESRAAFYGVKVIENVKGSQKLSVTLTRPFAQLNIGTTGGSIDLNIGDVVLEKSYVKIEGVAESFNTLDGKSGSEEATFEYAMADVIKDEDLTAAGAEYKYIAMNYLFVPNGEIADAKVTYELETSVGDLNNKIINVPFKTNYRTNIIGNLITSNITYEIKIDQNFNKPDEDMEYVAQGIHINNKGEYVITEAAGLRYVSNMSNLGVGTKSNSATAAFKEMFNGKTIVLADDIDLSGEDWTPINLRGVGSLTIDGAGRTISNMKIKGAGYLGFIGSCSSDVLIKDLTFSNPIVEGTGSFIGVVFGYQYGDVVLNNVDVEGGEVITSIANKGIRIGGLIGYSLTNDGATLKLEDCDVSGTTLRGYHNVGGLVGSSLVDPYGKYKFVSTMENCTVNDNTFYFSGKDNSADEDQPGGHHYFVCDGYNKAQTTLTDCTASGNTANFVTIPSEEKTLAELVAEAGAVVTVPAGEYTFPTKWGEGVTLICDEGVVFNGTSSLNINGSTVVGGTFSNPSGNAVTSTVNGTFRDCVFDGSNALRYCYPGAALIFEDCVFEGQDYAVHFDSGKYPITFNNCEFHGTVGLGAAIPMVTLEGCTMYKGGDGRFNITNLYGKSYLVNCNFVFDGSATKESIRIWNATKDDAGKYVFDGCKINGGNFILSYCCEKLSEGQKIKVDGVVYTHKTGGLMENEEGEIIASNATDLNTALQDEDLETVAMVEDVFIEKTTQSNGYGATGISMTNGKTFDGQGNTLSVPGANTTWASALSTNGGTIKNLTVDAGFRGIFVKGGSKTYLENVVIDGPVYTISCDSASEHGLEATNSTFNGWTSYAATIGDVKFEDCSFGEGAGYAFCRPYAPTEFVGCAFEEGFQIDARAAVTFENCTLNGEAITTDNLETLVTYNAENASIK